MTYSESAEGITISHQRALKEVRDHGIDVSEFIEEMGNHQTYLASDVLNWLGY